MGNRKPIGVFDSGVGGLTVVREILSAVPNERIVYLGDTGRYPYGPRSQEAIRSMAHECIAALVERDVKLMVIACNTATAFAFDYLRAQYPDLPFIGVVDPCVSVAASQFSSGRVGIIGTEGTISCGIYEQKLRALSPGLETVAAACPLLVPLAEEGVLDGPIVDRVLDMYLSPMKARGVQALIMGCTHYPFFRGGIEAYFGGQVKVLDSATWTARAVQEAMEQRFIKSGAAPQPMKMHRFFVTDFPEKFRRTGERFLGQALPFVEKIRLY
jgi:glutamate racemase